MDRKSCDNSKKQAIPTGAYQNPDFLKPYEDRGTIVNVPAGARVTVQATLIPKP